jgi:hypothetical protein
MTALLILIFGFLIMMPFSRAASFTDNNLFWLSCDNKTGYDNAGLHGIDGSNGTIVLNTSSKKVGNSSCQFKGASTDFLYYNDGAWNSIEADMTFCAWYYNENLLNYSNGFGFISKDDYSVSNHGTFQFFSSGTNNYYGSRIGTDEDTSATGKVTYKIWTSVCFTFSQSAQQTKVYVNGALNQTYITTQSPTNTATTLNIGQYYATTHLFIGNMDEIAFWNRALNLTDVETYYNSGLGYNPYSDSDVTAPIISVYKTPSNMTYNSIVSEITNISATITDINGIDNSTVFMQYEKVNLNEYINGSLVPNLNSLPYYNASGSSYNWVLSENDLLGGSNNLDVKLFENNTLKRVIISGNDVLKIEFLNISPIAEVSLYEYMSNETSANVEIETYFYCNSSYSTGNPLTNSNCAVFAQINNNLPYNHSHGSNSKHKVLPLGIDKSGKINRVQVTPRSYILKKVTGSGSYEYYINITSRTAATQISKNGGNTYVSQPFTMNTHIHQLFNGSAFNFTIIANDTWTPANKGTSVSYFDLIDLFSLSPNSVTIYSPLSDVSYTDEILINHSSAFAIGGAAIMKYQYFYAISNSSTWFEIINNTETSYLWDITTLNNRFYDLMIKTYDATNKTSLSYSSGFYINNSLSETETLLNQINNNLIESNKKQIIMNGAVEMIAYVILIVIFLILGITANPLFWLFASGVFGMMSIITYSTATASGAFFATSENWVKLIFFVVMFLAFAVLGILGSFTDMMENGKNKGGKKDFYDIY